MAKSHNPEAERTLVFPLTLGGGHLLQTRLLRWADQGPATCSVCISKPISHDFEVMGHIGYDDLLTTVPDEAHREVDRYSLDGASSRNSRSVGTSSNRDTDANNPHDDSLLRNVATSSHRELGEAHRTDTSSERDTNGNGQNQPLEISDALLSQSWRTEKNGVEISAPVAIEVKSRSLDHIQVNTETSRSGQQKGLLGLHEEDGTYRASDASGTFRSAASHRSDDRLNEDETAWHSPAEDEDQGGDSAAALDSGSAKSQSRTRQYNGLPLLKFASRGPLNLSAPF
eukprot:Selendium_serpulae@DN5056_c0_g1_i3.p1